MSVEINNFNIPTPDKHKVQFDPNIPLVKGTEPKLDVNGRLIYDHAMEVDYNYSEQLWDITNEAMNQNINRRNSQIVLVNPYNRSDTIGELDSILTPVSNIDVPIAKVYEDRYPDGEKDLMIINESPDAQHIYIVASILNEDDFSRVKRIAYHYQHTLPSDPWITLVATFMSATRQDKNVNDNGIYLPKPLNIAAEVAGLTPFIHRFIVFEPHSSTTQAVAAQHGRPLAPITPCLYVMDQLINRGVKVPNLNKRIKPTPENAVVIRPDKGRNIAAMRISQYYGFPSVSFEKRRLSGFSASIYELEDWEQELVKDRMAIGFDDEFSTLGTVESLANALERYEATAFAVAGVHGKFTGNEWKKRIKHPLLTTILITDSRIPVSRIDQPQDGPQIEITSLAPTTLEIIEADMRGENFWRNPDFNHMILQEKSK